MKSYNAMNLSDGYRFIQTGDQLKYEYFDGININTISKWKVGLNCDIGSVRSFILSNIPEIKPDDPKLIDYIDGLEYEDALI